MLRSRSERTRRSITVIAATPLLRTENAEQSTTISRENLYALPLNFSSTQGGAIRNPLSFANLAPGVYFRPGSQNTIKVNPSPSTRFKIMLDGQDATPSNAVETTNHNQPSLEAMEEFTLQASNFAAEFGQALGGLFNFTARSGPTNFTVARTITSSTRSSTRGSLIPTTGAATCPAPRQKA